MDVTRRTLLTAAATGAAVLSVPSLARPRRYKVRLGIQTYSFRDLLPTPGDTVDKMIQACKDLGVDMIELFEPTVEPPALSAHAAWAFTGGKPTEASLYGRPPEGTRPAAVLQSREDLRKYRLATPIARFREIGRRFRAAGIEVQAFNFGLKDDCTDAEVEWGFAATKALGTNLMTASTTLSMLRRTAPFAARHRTLLGLHGHSNLRDPNQLATPESFEQGLAMSPWYRLNFDIGHFAAAGFDTLGFLHRHHENVCSVHLKDRKANFGMNMPYGQGDTPIAGVVRTITENGWNIPIFLEYEYAGGPSQDELRRSLAYVRKFVVR
ncbi:sugar phosphate isomerase/epimerase [Novosphingobium sp. P6W]|uniref:sugar phosphate isomerase/epimerase family protein n=1 Tax=Novosphingobium sp. P6W TaxID=1609758 RepID=UPI000698CC76|nr:TIM barrel protein [Novosphingobium sp. P6W]AXB78603.1 sugar phosphate isomerase/epimerase [Novosphingobium sp. P6W]